MGKKTAALLLAAFMLSACSAGNGGEHREAGGSSSPSPATADGSTAPGENSLNAKASSSTQASPAGGLTPAAPGGAVSPAPAVTPAASPAVSAHTDSGETEGKPAAPLLYYMNQNFDIKPIQDGTNKKVVLLTFDDGPKEAGMINSIFDTLDKHHAKAIFFVNGYRVKEHPELLKLIQERGGIIGNHSWDHIVLKDKSYAEVKKQIEDVQTIVKEMTGETPVFFRPPHGAGGDVGRKVASENGLLYMTWSNGSLDWTLSGSESGKTDKIIHNVTGQLHSGSNILMHELPWTAEALDKLLTTLEGKGYGFVDPESIDPDHK